MKLAKRIFFFLAVNFLVVMTISVILSLFNVRPYLNAYGLDYRSLMIFCLIWGMGGALISLAISRMIAKWMMGVQIINARTANPEQQELLTTVHALAKRARLKAMPEVGIYDSSEPNAFATGPSQRRALVAVSTGLLRKMSHQELEGVLAHEITHISNGDMVTMTLIQGIVNAFVMFLARILAFAVSGLGRNKESSSSGGSYFSYAIFTFVFEILFMILGSMVVASFSRAREFRADKGGATLAGKEKMIAALESLQRLQQVRDPHPQPAAVQALKISTPKKSGLLHLFATHPPLDVRIARLRGGR